MFNVLSTAKLISESNQSDASFVVDFQDQYRFSLSQLLLGTRAWLGEITLAAMIPSLVLPVFAFLL